MNRDDVPHLMIPDDDAATEDVSRVLEWMQALLFKYPGAVQAAYRALVREGRSFSATDDGRRWRARLQASPAIERLRPLWEAATFNALESDGTQMLPTLLLDLVAQLVSSVDVEEITIRLTEATAATSRRMSG